jgi:hypothetical protein
LTAAQAGRDGDEPGDRAGRRAEGGGVAVAQALGGDPGQQRCGGGDLRVDERQRRGAVGAQGRPGVEAEPAEPQQPRAEHHEREVVRPHRLATEALALAEDEHEREGGRARVDVDGRATREVDGAQPLHDPAAGAVGERPVLLQDPEVEDPVRHREVDERRPQRREDDPRAELHAVGDGAADERHGDHGEHELEAGEREVGQSARDRVGGQVVQAQEPGREAEQPAVRRAEGDGVAVQDPQDADDAQRAEAHHQHVEHALAARHAAVEQREARVS